MAKQWTKVGGAAACVAAVLTVAVSRNGSTRAAAKPDLKPAAHWVFDADGVTGRTVADRTGKLPGTLLGTPTVVADGPTPHLHLTGPDDGVMVRPRVTPHAPILPPEALSVVAWVRIDQPTAWGGVLGCFQDNGPVKCGFVTGFNRKKFYFGLTTKASRKMTYLESNTEYTRGKWYHLAAVYDGKQMRLYVNGQLDATSGEQSGPVLYAKAAPLVIGRYKDDDEDFSMQGAIKEVMLCGHAVGAEEIAAHFEADRAFAEQPSVLPEGPRFVVEPYLQYVTRSGVTVMWETEEPCTAVVEYGTTYPPQQQAKAEKADTMGEVQITNLEPNTKYFYRVVCTDEAGRKLVGKPLTFMTAPD